MLTIDGVAYDVKCEVKRTAEMKASEISGMLLDKSYFSDVIGTFLTYSVAFTYPLWNRDKYAAVFEALTAPVESHAFVLPYNNGAVALTARVELASDERVEMESGRGYWRRTQFDIIANHPTKTLSLGEVILRGRPRLPEVADLHTGDTYTWTGTGWSASGLPDGDAMSF